MAAYLYSWSMTAHGLKDGDFLSCDNVFDFLRPRATRSVTFAGATQDFSAIANGGNAAGKLPVSSTDLVATNVQLFLGVSLTDAFVSTFKSPYETSCLFTFGEAPTSTFPGSLRPCRCISFGPPLDFSQREEDVLLKEDGGEIRPRQKSRWSEAGCLV